MSYLSQHLLLSTLILFVRLTSMFKRQLCALPCYEDSDASMCEVGLSCNSWFMHGTMLAGCHYWRRQWRTSDWCGWQLV